MRKVNTIMLELLKLFPRYEFEKLEKQYKSNHYTKYFSGWQQLITILFAQIGSKDSLREIETLLSMHYNKWYHIGLQGVKRSTLSDARCVVVLTRFMKEYFINCMLNASP